uniref:FDF domain-containing protein n=1 Tax=Hymenolepis diminuta TaxID=6216 RepID=A0A0R3SWZ9_HYMDI
LNQLIELINEMPKHRDKNGEDKVQMQPQRGRPRESVGSRWESRKRDDGDAQSNFSFRMIGGNRKKFNWPKLRKSKAQADFQMENQMESDREMNANFEAGSHYQADMDMVPCMVPRVRFNSGGSRCAPSGCCSGDANFEIRMYGDCDCDGRFDDDVEVGINRDFDEGFSRPRRFSGSYEGDFYRNFNGGMNNGALGRSFNNGMDLGFQGGVQGAPNFGMNGGMNNGMGGGFNNGMGLGIQGGPLAGIKGGMSENLNGIAGVGNLAALSGLCVSLNALNGALGDLSGRLGNMNSVVGAGMGGNTGMNSGMISTGRSNGLNIGVGMQGVGGTLSVGSGMNFSGQNISNVRQNSKVDAGGRVQKSIGSSFGQDDNFGRSMVNLQTTHGDTSGLDVYYLNQSGNPSGNNRSSSVPPRTVGLSLNTNIVDDGDYEIQYIERKLRF